jgi:hypothetical protein
MPITRGATPAVAMPTMRARGVRPYCAAVASSASSSAQAPSFTPEALPAVTVPSGRTTGFSLASASRLVSRGCSSCANHDRLAFFWGISHRHDLRRSTGLPARATAFSWLASAKASWSSRLIL